MFFLNPSISFAFSFLYNTCVCLSSLISHRGCFNFHGISRMVLISVFHFHLFKVLRNLPQFDRTSLSNKVLWRNFRGCLWVLLPSCWVRASLQKKRGEFAFIHHSQYLVWCLYPSIRIAGSNLIFSLPVRMASFLGKPVPSSQAVS